MNRKNRKYIDELLQNFNSEYKELAKKVVDEILKLLSEGLTVADATKQAFANNNFDYELQVNLKDKIFRAACFGYGIEPVIDAETITSKLTELSWNKDKMNLNDRLHRLSKVQAKQVNNILKSNIENGTRWVKLSRELYDGYNAEKVMNQAELPEYLDRLQALSKQVFSTNGVVDKDLMYEYNKTLKYAKKAVDEMSKNGAPNKNLKTAYKQLVDAAEDGRVKALERACDVAVQERSRYYAERIARTEMARAWIDGFYTDTLSDNSIVAYKYVISTRHPNTDICDINATANICGIGKGIYKKNLVPRLPAHPHCLCRLESIYVDEIDESKEYTTVKKVDGQDLEKPFSRLSKQDFNTK